MKLSELQRLATRGGKKHTMSEEELQAFLHEQGIDINNFYQEMEMSNRFVDTHRDTSTSGSVISLHSHSFYEILYCRTSSNVEYLVGPERYRLQRGDIVIVPPGISHRPIFPTKMTEAYRRDVLWLSQEFESVLFSTFPEIKNYPRFEPQLLRTAGTKWDFFGDLFSKGIHEAANKEVGWQLSVLGNTLLIISSIYRALADGSIRGLEAEEPQLFDRIIAYVEAQYATRITLEDTARQFFVSSSTISQLFRDKMGVSFYRCVTQRRLIAAKTLILDGHAMESIPKQIGFSDYSAFYRAFRQEFGISPTQFRDTVAR